MSGASSAAMRVAATSWMPTKANQASPYIFSGRPEWPWVTRLTIATSTLPNRPMNSACAGARPSANTPDCR